MFFAHFRIDRHNGNLRNKARRVPYVLLYSTCRETSFQKHIEKLLIWLRRSVFRHFGPTPPQSPLPLPSQGMQPVFKQAGVRAIMECMLCAKKKKGNRCMQMKNRALLACADGTTMLGHSLLYFFVPAPGCSEPVRVFAIPQHGAFLCMECQQQHHHFLGMPQKLQSLVPGTYLLNGLK